MLRNSEIDLRALRFLYWISLLVCILVELNATPVPVPTMDSTSTDPTDSLSSTLPDNDLYVIKAVVYEIGILTDTDNTTSDSTERQEEVKISLFDQPGKGDEYLKQNDTLVPDTFLLK